MYLFDGVINSSLFVQAHVIGMISLTAIVLNQFWNNFYLIFDFV